MKIFIVLFDKDTPASAFYILFLEKKGDFFPVVLIRKHGFF